MSTVAEDIRAIAEKLEKLQENDNEDRIRKMQISSRGSNRPISELQLGDEPSSSSELILDEGYVIKMGNGGIAITKNMFEKQVSIQLHHKELLALMKFVENKPLQKWVKDKVKGK